MLVMFRCCELILDKVICSKILTVIYSDCSMSGLGGDDCAKSSNGSYYNWREGGKGITCMSPQLFFQDIQSVKHNCVITNIMKINTSIFPLNQSFKLTIRS